MASGNAGAAEPRLGIEFAYELTSALSIGAARFMQAIDAHDLRVHRTEKLAVGEGALQAIEELGEVEALSQDEHRTGLLIRVRNGFAWLRLNDGSATVDAAGPDAAAVDQIVDRVVAKLPKPPKEANTVSVSFWAGTENGVRREHRTFPSRPWSELAGGYGSATAARLGDLAGARQPGHGNLLLWHGAPGTGKTNALRALAYEWREWCSVNFIIDPERFLGDTGTCSKC